MTLVIVNFFSYSLDIFQIAIFFTVAMLIGMSKTGVHGAGMMAVPMLAAVFGGQLSTGILLPILCLADILGVLYYRRHASWKHLRQLFPAAAAGIVLGTLLGGVINDTAFRIIMAVAILLTVLLMLWLQTDQKNEIPSSVFVARLMGVVGGFTSMVGNLAGPVMAVYFLSMKLPKNIFIGTTAWFFLVINFFKIPFHVFHWKTISVNSFLMDLSTIPFIVVGGMLGIVVVRRLSEKTYRWFIIATTIIAAVFMLI